MAEKDETIRTLGQTLVMRKDAQSRLHVLDGQRIQLAQALQALATAVLGEGKCIVEEEEMGLVFSVYEEGKCEPTRVICPSAETIMDFLIDRNKVQAQIDQANKILKDYL